MMTPLFTVPIRLLRSASIAAYLFFGIAAEVPLHSSHLPPYVWICFVGAILICDIVATQKPEITAFLIAKRDLVTFGVLLFSIVAGSLCLSMAHGAGTLEHRKIVVVQFALQGALVGVLVRVLVLAMFARLVRGAPIEINRLMLLMALTVLIWLFPLGESHRLFAGLYIFGFGLGFALHYLVRLKEHSNAEAARLGRSIVESLGHTKLESAEIDAVRYFAKQEWRSLKQLLKAHELEQTTVLEIIKASMLHITGDYANAVTTLEAELRRPEHDSSLDTYLYLHQAISLSDLNQKQPMQDAIDKALDCHNDCVLSLITKSLRTAEAIPLDEQDHEELREQAFRYISQAMQGNDVARPELVARIVGRAVPFNWTFLMDAYAYVLLKAKSVRLSKAMLTECIYEDPYFSSPYLHFAEWCIADILRAQRLLTGNDAKHHKISGAQESAMRASSERSQRVARLCLHIAIALEGKKESLTKRRAEELLREYRHILYQSHGEPRSSFIISW